VQRYLVESYAPAVPGEQAVGTADAFAQLEGSDIRHVRTTVIAEDELALHVFDAHSPEALGAALERAGLVPLRIVPAHDWNSSDDKEET
jgi:hypothetical protein